MQRLRTKQPRKIQHSWNRGNPELHQGKHPMQQQAANKSGPQVILPNGSLMKSTHGVLLNLKPLPTKTEMTKYIYPYLQPGDLIPIGKLCNDVCTATFTFTHFNVVNYGLTVLDRKRLNKSCMWQVNLTRNPYHLPIHQQPAALNALAARSNIELSQWYHVTLFRPVPQNLLQDIKKGHFSAYPNLTVELMKHLPHSTAKAKNT